MKRLDINASTLPLFSAFYPLENKDVPVSSSLKDFTPVQAVKTLNTEISIMGYALSQQAMHALTKLNAKEFVIARENLIESISRLNGYDKTFRTLFSKFPYHLEDDMLLLQEQASYQFRDFMRIHFDVFLNEYDVSVSEECGHPFENDTSDSWGGCPICGTVDAENDHLQKSAKHEFSNITPLKTIDVMFEDEIAKRCQDLLERNSSLSLQEKLFVQTCAKNADIFRLVNGSLDLEHKFFREQIPLALEFISEDRQQDLMKSATDVLRIATYWSNPDNADLSLASNPRFKLTTSQKKRIMFFMNVLVIRNKDAVLEDMMRHREKWLRLGEVINPGAKRNIDRWNHCYFAFSALRNHNAVIPTYSRMRENVLKSRKFTKADIDDLVSRPGEFMRILDALLRRAEGDDAMIEHVLDGLTKCLAKTPLKRLMEVSKYLNYRGFLENDAPINGFRTFIPKGSVTKIKTIKDTRKQVQQATYMLAIDMIDEAISKRIKENFDPIAPAYIDFALTNIVMPQNQRGASSTRISVPRGSRIPLKTKNVDVVRIFLHWTGDTDLDLSAVAFGQDFEVLGHVDFTHLEMEGILHSGDVQSAPDGGSEFIDLDIKSLKAQGIRYIATNTISYSGKTFDQLDAFIGFMTRDEMRSGEKYEPASVEFSFDIRTPSKYHSTLLFDIELGSFIFIDVSRDLGPRSVSARLKDEQREIIKAVLSMPFNTLTVHDVLAHHLNAHGKWVMDPDKADVIFNLDNLDLEEMMKKTA